LPKKLLRVALENPEEIDHLAVEIVKHLTGTPRLGQQHRGRAGEGLAVDPMLRDQGEDGFG
jgi:hypothetical protein